MKRIVLILPRIIDNGNTDEQKKKIVKSFAEKAKSKDSKLIIKQIFFKLEGY